jgi:hypothetical protein
MARKRKLAPSKRSARNATRNATPRPRREKPGPGRPPAATMDWAITFLAALRDGLHVRDACQAACVDHSVAYRRRAEDPAFRATWEEARAVGAEELLAEAYRRAYYGTEKPVYYKGEEVDRIWEYSDTLLMFLLAGEFPEKYRKSRHEHSGPDGKPIEHNVNRKEEVHVWLQEYYELAGRRGAPSALDATRLGMPPITEAVSEGPDVPPSEE